MDINYLKAYTQNLPRTICKYIITVYLFGSTARGDNDENSDHDLLIIIDKCNDTIYKLILQKLNSFYSANKIEISLYQIDTIERMQKRGSYFLWHIRCEGIMIYEVDNRFRLLLSELPAYTGTKEDFIEYRQIINDIKESLAFDNATLFFELATLASIVRNTCIGLCYTKGIMDFGRTSVLITCLKLFGSDFPFSLEEYEKLYRFRLKYIRGNIMGVDIPDIHKVNEWINKTEFLFEFV